MGVILPGEEIDEDEKILAKNSTLLKRAKLDVQVMVQFVNDPTTLYQVLGDAGVKSPGDRLKIISAVRKNSASASAVHGSVI